MKASWIIFLHCFLRKSVNKPCQQVPIPSCLSYSTGPTFPVQTRQSAHTEQEAVRLSSRTEFETVRVVARTGQEIVRVVARTGLEIVRVVARTGQEIDLLSVRTEQVTFHPEIGLTMPNREAARTIRESSRMRFREASPPSRESVSRTRVWSPPSGVWLGAQKIIIAVQREID